MKESDCSAVSEEAHDLFENGDFKKSFHLYLLLAEKGFIQCQKFIAWMYLEGIGVEKSRANAYQWYRRPAIAGDFESQFLIAKLYAEDGDIENSTKWYQSSASLGYAPAQYRLGCYYESGHGVARDIDRSLGLFEAAAEQGHLYAKKAYAVRLMKGRKGWFRSVSGLIIYVTLPFILIKVAIGSGFDDESLRI